jgi:hypothetical protein
MEDIITSKEEVLQAPEIFGFVEDESTKTIPLTMLEQSIRVEGKHGRVLATRPVQSWTVVAFILGLLEAQEVNYNLESLYVQKRNSFPMLTDDEKKLGYDRSNCPIRKWMFDKVLATIQIPNLGNDLVCARIGMRFSEEGIETAFGLNVRTCSNFAIMGGSLLHTFKQNGREGQSWESIEYQLKEWTASLDQKMKVEMDIMARMQNAPISAGALEFTIGDLYRKAIDQAYISKQPAPFDTAGMSNFVQKMLMKKKDVGAHEFNRPVDLNTVWDLYNYGTSVMKPEIMDIAGIQSSSALFAEYLLESFELNKN